MLFSSDRLSWKQRLHHKTVGHEQLPHEARFWDLTSILDRRIENSNKLRCIEPTKKMKIVFFHFSLIYIAQLWVSIRKSGSIENLSERPVFQSGEGKTNSAIAFEY